MNKKFYIWIDEFTYLIKSDKTIISVLQRFIDNFLRKSKIYLIISGSMFNLVLEEILSYSSPLYGRRDLDLFLDKIKYPYFLDFFRNKKEALLFYFIVGGIPEYLKIASNYNNIDEFIKKEFFNKYGYFYREPLFILSQDFKEIKTYFSIIQAISFGYTKATEIANFVGLETRKIFGKRFEIFAREIVPFMLNFKVNIICKYFIDYNDPIKKKKRSIDIDLIALNEQEKKIAFIETKWKDLKISEAKKIIKELEEKKEVFYERTKIKNDLQEYFCVIAKNINKKAKEWLKSNGFIAFDLRDLENKLI